MRGRNAVVIGMPNFDDLGDNSSINDAQKIEELLSKNADGSTNFEVLRPERINSQGHFRKIVKELFSKETEVSLLYFSGHGSSDAYASYLRMPESDEQDLGFRMDEILSIANGSMKPQSKVIILDCCDSGAIGSNSKRFGNSSVIERGVTVLTASLDGEPSKATRGEHSLFTSLLIKALEGGAADLQGGVSPGSIYAYVEKALGAWAQRPLFMANVSNYISLRQCEPPISVQVIKNLAVYFETIDDIYALDPSYEFTNSPDDIHELIEPYAVEENVEIFKELQQAVKVGLVQPVGEEHMYFAAMKGKGCCLTSLGKHYWELANNERLG
jgi:hypothetical protein